MNLGHHAICIEGNCEEALQKLHENLKEAWSFAVASNPDYLFQEFDVFGIDDAHMVREFQIKKPIGGERKVVVISANSLTGEAQNSLLKIFEEPAPNTHFFLIIHSSENLLPTLRSRMQIEKLSESEKVSVAKKFLKASKKERLEMIKSITEDKDKQAAIEILNGVEKEIMRNKKAGNLEASEVELLKTLNQFRSYLNDRAPALKMILEHVALTTPQM